MTHIWLLAGSVFFAGLLVHSYVIYPLIMRLLAAGKSNNTEVFKPDDRQLPHVSVIMSLYNEEKVITLKLDTLLAQRYPTDKYAVYIGSDGSSDQTNAIVEQKIRGKAGFYFFSFSQRRGKPGVINELIEVATHERGKRHDHVLVLTDASVMLSPEVVYHLCKHFKHPHIGVVDAFMIHTGLENQGISRSEDQYISSEVMLKYRESIVWRKMIGPFGGCYALRSDLVDQVPANFLVDDFYLTMRAFEQGAWAINEPEARCYEPVSQEWQEEFRRKARISAGNFQNMARFARLWWPPLNALAFAFFSHKILRWMGPFWLLGMAVCLLIAAFAGSTAAYFALLGFAALVLGIPLLDVLLKHLGINVLFLRNVRYFLLMNLALLQGFFKYLKGIQTNVWEPTKRN